MLCQKCGENRAPRRLSILDGRQEHRVLEALGRCIPEQRISDRNSLFRKITGIFLHPNLKNLFKLILDGIQSSLNFDES